MLQKTLFTVFLFIVLMQSVWAQSTLTGTVVNGSGDPVGGATVVLRNAEKSFTTLYDGRFSFSTTGVISQRNNSAHCGSFVYRDRTLHFYNPVLQKISIELFDLNGKRISVLYKGSIGPGVNQFKVSPQVSAQVLFLRWRTSLGEGVHLVNTGGIARFEGTYEGSTAKKQAAATMTDLLIVKHHLYDDAVMALSSYAGDITVKMPHRKLNTACLNTLHIGDTLWNTPEALCLSLDSIFEQRCPCSSLCLIPGWIDIYLNLTVGVVSMPVHLQGIEPFDTTVAGYRLVVSSLNPTCPKQGTIDDYGNYFINVNVTPADNPRKILFLDHPVVVEQQCLSGTNCPGLCIDFPTYNYNKQLKILSGIIPSGLDDSMQMIYGSALWMEGISGGGASGLKCVKTFPYSERTSSFSGNDTIVIEDLNSDGTVRLQYRGESISLSVGESWSGEYVWKDTSDDYIIQSTASDSITNYGYLFPWNFSPNR
ncbi:MAG TPA: carboxypeptidase-like regulatory domain-containing protein [Chitinispirillaceae bacterium]|nr:carboxypeptidase-like regulatory domain-containing protein [Chitinispirillaceae bacterium]